MAPAQQSPQGDDQGRLHYADLGATVHIGEVDATLALELPELYSSCFSVREYFDLYDRPSALHACELTSPRHVLLFDRRGHTVDVLNKVIDIEPESVERFAHAIYRAFPGVLRVRAEVKFPPPELRIPSRGASEGRRLSRGRRAHRGAGARPGAPAARFAAACATALLALLCGGLTVACSDAGDGPSSTPEAPVAPSGSATTPPSAVLVTDFGAAGDGAADDTAAVEAALRSAATQGSAIHFPPGTYAVGDLTIPDGVILAGTGGGRAWLRGRVQVGGDSHITDLTIGRDGAALRFVDGASGTVFRRVRFVGGGGMESGEDQGVIRFSAGRSAWGIWFVECVIGANSADGNGVSMVSRGRPGGTYRDITWVRCRFEGSPRMNVEVIQRPDGEHPVTQGYRRIDFIDCVFEPSGSESVSYDAIGAAGDCTISGCTFKGAGWNRDEPYGQGIEFNGPTGMRFIGNTVYRCRQAMINHKGTDGVVTATVIEGNVFDGTRSFIDVVPERPAQTIYFSGVSGARFAGNVVKTDVGGELAYLDESSRNTFAGNSWLDTRPPGEAFACVILTDGSSSNEFVRERFQTASGDHAVRVQDGSRDNRFRDCLFLLTGADAAAATPGVAVEPGLTVRIVGGEVRRQ